MEPTPAVSTAPSPGSARRKPSTAASAPGQDASLSGRRLFDDAAASRTVWCRVKGYPWWPAQVLTKKAAQTHLSSVPHKNKTDSPVIFFGTSEIAWVAERDVASWEAGVGQCFHSKGRKNKKFIAALDQVRAFLSVTGPRSAPLGWWCAAPERNADPVHESDDEMDAFEAQQEALRRPQPRHANTENGQQEGQDVEEDGAGLSDVAAGEVKAEGVGDETLHMAAAAIADLACGHMVWPGPDEVRAELQQRKKGSTQRRQQQQQQRQEGQQQEGQQQEEHVEMQDAEKGDGGGELQRPKRPRSQQRRRTPAAAAPGDVGGTDTEMEPDVATLHDGGAEASDAECSGRDAGDAEGAGKQLLQGCGPSTKRRKLQPQPEAAATAAAAAADPAEAGPSEAATNAPAPLQVLPSDWLEQGPVLPEAPVDFELPRGYLLNRPPQYEHVRRNTWVSRGRPKRLNKDEVSVCNCRAEIIPGKDGTPDVRTGCVDGCLNRLSYIHCDPRTCPCGPECTNRPFHLVKGPKMEVFLTEDRGHGVRSTAHVPRGSFVVEYAGEVIDEAELQRRMDACGASGEQHFYIMELQPGLFIDARKRGNLARLLNSSCDPNCETQKWFDAATGEVRIGIFARRDIGPGEELTYDYMFEHYGLANVAQGFRCQCGAKNCRGTMDINPERRRDLGRRVEVFWEGDGVFYRGTIMSYSITSRKHTVLYDDGDQERVCLDAVPHRWLEEHASPRPSAQAPSPTPSGDGRRYGPHPSPRPLHDSADSDGSWSQADGANAELDSAAQAAAEAAEAAAAVAAIVAPQLLGRGRRVPGAVARPVVARELWEDDANAASALMTLGLAAMEVVAAAGEGAVVDAAGAVVDAAAAAGSDGAKAAVSGREGASSDQRLPKKRRLALSTASGGVAAATAAAEETTAAGVDAATGAAAAHTSSTSSQSACQLEQGHGSQPTAPHSRAGSVTAAAAAAAAVAAGIAASPGRSGGRPRSSRKQQQPSPAASRGRGGEMPEDAVAHHKSSGAGESEHEPAATGSGAAKAAPDTATAATAAAAATATAVATLGALSSSLQSEMVPMQQLMQGISDVKSQGPALFQRSASSSKGSLGSTATTAAMPALSAAGAAAAFAAGHSQQSVGQSLAAGSDQPAGKQVLTMHARLLKLVKAVEPEIAEHYGRSGQLAAAAAAAAATASGGVYDPHAAALAAAASAMAGKEWTANPPLFCSPAQTQLPHARAGVPAHEVAIAALMQQQQMAAASQAAALLALQQQQQQQQHNAATELQRQLSLGIAAAALAPVAGWQGLPNHGHSIGAGVDAMHLDIGMLPIHVSHVQPGPAARTQTAMPASQPIASPAAAPQHAEVLLGRPSSAFSPVAASPVACAGAVSSMVQHEQQQQQQVQPVLDLRSMQQLLPCMQN